jgi:autotransporter-associated beta strand protein
MTACRKPSIPRPARRFPTSLTGLTSDVYRGLEYSILKNKSSKLFTTTSEHHRAVGAATPGLDKMTGFYSDFLEAAAYRECQWRPRASLPVAGRYRHRDQMESESANEQSPRLPNVGARSPRRSCRASSSPATSPISSTSAMRRWPMARSTATEPSPASRQINAGTARRSPITIGTPNVGFIMQLGNDNGKTVTLSGANTYTGGTSILAGNLIIASDASLGAAVARQRARSIPTMWAFASVQAANGIIFNSLTEGNGTLTIGTAVGTGGTTFDRPADRRRRRSRDHQRQRQYRDAKRPARVARNEWRRARQCRWRVRPHDRRQPPTTRAN